MHAAEGLDHEIAELLSKTAEGAEGSPEGLASRPPRGGRVVALVAAGVLLCALLSAFSPYFGSDLRREAPAVQQPDAAPGGHPGGGIGALDHRFVVWLVARNAWTWLHRPLSLFDAEPCFPEPQALSLGESGLAFGFTGIPGWLLTGDPVASYDLALVALSILWAVAIYLLVRDWTGIPAAALVAALLFAFHPVKRDEILHPYAWDNGWAVLALFFAVRLFERRRWRDAAGLAVAVALELGSSLYATLGVACLALPLLAWLVALHGVRGQRPAQWLAVALGIAAAGAAVFGPYLAREAGGELAVREYQHFLTLASLAPSGAYWPGVALLALAAAGVALHGSRFPSGPLRDPRAALCVGALLALLVAGGGFPELALPARPGEAARPLLASLYRALARLVPGLEVIRGVSRLYSAVLLALCILAGLGAAALLRRAPARWRAPLAALLVGVAYVDTLRPASLGLTPRVAYRMTEIAPPREQIAFFARLAELGNAGPLAETPLHRKTHMRNNTALLLTAYHHRRTSACRNSFLPRGLAAVEADLARLPEPAAVARLRARGFTTIVLHHASATPHQEALRRRFARLAAQPGAPIALVHANESLSAFAITR